MGRHLPSNPSVLPWEVRSPCPGSTNFGLPGQSCLPCPPLWVVCARAPSAMPTEQTDALAPSPEWHGENVKPRGPTSRSYLSLSTGPQSHQWPSHSQPTRVRGGERNTKSVSLGIVKIPNSAPGSAFCFLSSILAAGGCLPCKLMRGVGIGATSGH